MELLNLPKKFIISCKLSYIWKHDDISGVYMVFRKRFSGVGGMIFFKKNSKKATNKHIINFTR